MASLPVDARPVPGWPGIHVTADGHVWRDHDQYGPNWREVAQFSDRKGYLRVRLLKADGLRKTQTVHALVATAFHGPRPSSSHECRHLDGDPANNRADNLAWGTAAENAADRERHGRTSRGETHASAIKASTQAFGTRRYRAEQAAKHARLIAAAPDGLDFAKALDALWVQIIPHGPGDPGEPRIFDAETLAVWRQCRAFIAKATGEGAS